MYTVYDTQEYVCEVVIDGQYSRRVIPGTYEQLTRHHIHYLRDHFVHNNTQDGRWVSGIDINTPYQRVAGYLEDGRILKERMNLRLSIWVKDRKQAAQYYTYQEALEICSRLPNRPLLQYKESGYIKQAYQRRSVGINAYQYRLVDRIAEQYQEVLKYAPVKQPKQRHTRLKEGKKTVAGERYIRDIERRVSKSWKDQTRNKRQYE